MPWYLILLVIVGQFLLILYLRDSHETEVGILNTQIATLEEDNRDLTKSIDICRKTGENAVIVVENTLNEEAVTKEEQHRIEMELCKLGWGTSPSGKNNTFKIEDKENVKTIKHDDVFDDAINSLLKSAYDCATGRVCLSPNP